MLDVLSTPSKFHIHIIILLCISDYYYSRYMSFWLITVAIVCAPAECWVFESQLRFIKKSSENTAAKVWMSRVHWDDHYKRMSRATKGVAH